MGLLHVKLLNHHVDNKYNDLLSEFDFTIQNGTVEFPNKASLYINDQVDAMCFAEICVWPAMLFSPKIWKLQLI